MYPLKSTPPKQKRDEIKNSFNVIFQRLYKMHQQILSQQWKTALLTTSSENII